jgi:hypothetical protein
MEVEVYRARPASTIPKDDDHLAEGPDGEPEALTRSAIRSLTELSRWCESTVRSDGSKKRREMDTRR